MIPKRRNRSENFDYICATKIYNSAKKCSCHNLNGKLIDKLVTYETIRAGLKNNCFFIKKLNALKSSLSIDSAFDKHHMPEFADICTITESICNSEHPCFIHEIIDLIFWDNTSIDIHLKNCNK